MTKPTVAELVIQHKRAASGIRRLYKAHTGARYNASYQTRVAYVDNFRLMHDAETQLRQIGYVHLALDLRIEHELAAAHVLGRHSPGRRDHTLRETRRSIRDSVEFYGHRTERLDDVTADNR